MLSVWEDRLARVVVAIEAALFTVAVGGFFIGKLVQGLSPHRTPLEFAYEMALLVMVFGAIWVLGFIAVSRRGPLVLAGIALRVAIMAAVYFTQLGLMVAMLLLAPSSLVLLVYAASRCTYVRT